MIFDMKSRFQSAIKNDAKLHEKGFSLIEIALALLLIGIFFASMFTSTGELSLIEKKQRQAAMMPGIHQAMATYLKVNRHLPCPDTDGDGKENRKITSGVSVCKSRSGTLPYRDLSVSAKDVWGNAYYYQVNARAENKKYVNDMCQTASVFGEQGEVTISKDLGYCPSMHIYYCGHCEDVCPALQGGNGNSGNGNNGNGNNGNGNNGNGNNGSICQTQDQIDLSSFNSPPYMQLGTPPVGVDKAGDGTNSHKNLWLEDLSGNEIENALVYMIVSFGADGVATWNSCQEADSTNQRENCDGDEVFSETKGDMQDFLDGMTVLQAKQALLDVGAIK